MQTVNEKLLTELKSSPIKTVNGEMVTLIDEDLRCALFDLLSPSQGLNAKRYTWQVNKIKGLKT
jgi:hypothetical protein